MEDARVSVRGLVEFSLHGEDIVPGASLQAMEEGRLGHTLRQRILGENWQSEVPVQKRCPLEDGGNLLISGRMDAFCPGEVPVVEEIKLCAAGRPPAFVRPEHRAQAAVYAFFVCESENVPFVKIQVVYVDREGREQASFPEEGSRERWQREFEALLTPYLERLRLLRAHKRERDASLLSLAFPFPCWRSGQREMAAQVYFAIRDMKRLFACMPTGSGKSAATIFPALKAMGEGKTGRVFYLTARTTQRQGPRQALGLMREMGAKVWTLTLDAKEKQCPMEIMSCHPDRCPRAKGHYLRDAAAISEMLLTEDWTPESIRDMADRYQLCPFEFSLALAEISDVTVCDYNYALHPAIRIQRIFERTRDVTLLIDEAHHLTDRTREMIGGRADSVLMRSLRTAAGKTGGRKHPVYRALTRMIQAVESAGGEEKEEEQAGETLPEGILPAADDLLYALGAAAEERFDWLGEGERVRELMLDLMGFERALGRDRAEYSLVRQGKKRVTLTMLPLRVDRYLNEATASMKGTILFSATLQPLSDTRCMLGGEEQDVLFEMPSPFPKENLLILRENVSTRYADREASLDRIAETVRIMQRARPGHYIVYFPSFAYMRRAAERLGDFPFQMQETKMTDAAREAFLLPYRPGMPPVTSLCVMGGVFSEGIDLPGRALDGVIIVGVGLPQVNIFQETLRKSQDSVDQQGFRKIYQIPGMQKVSQAVGRVIRTEKDRGVAILMDDRYWKREYLELCPSHWRFARGSMQKLLSAFAEQDPEEMEKEETRRCPAPEREKQK